MSANAEHGTVSAAEMAAGAPVWDHSTHERFFDYYARESQSEEALQRFSRVRDTILRLRRDGVGRVPKTDGDDGWRVLKVLEASQRSLNMNGEPVQLDLQRSRELIRA